MAGVHRGIEAALSVVAEWTGAFEDYRWEVEKLIDAGERVVAVGKQSGRGPGSGIEIEAEQAHVWMLRDGRPIRMEMFPSKADALEVAGLRGGE